MEEDGEEGPGATRVVEEASDAVSTFARGLAGNIVGGSLRARDDSLWVGRYMYCIHPKLRTVNCPFQSKRVQGGLGGRSKGVPRQHQQHTI